MKKYISSVIPTILIVCATSLAKAQMMSPLLNYKIAVKVICTHYAPKLNQNGFNDLASSCDKAGNSAKDGIEYMSQIVSVMENMEREQNVRANMILYKALKAMSASTNFLIKTLKSKVTNSATTTNIQPNQQPDFCSILGLDEKNNEECIKQVVDDAYFVSGANQQPQIHGAV